MELKTWFVSWETGIDYGSNPLDRCALRGVYTYSEAVAEMERLHEEGHPASCVQVSQPSRIAMGAKR
jgi:hypothetical protein